MSCQFFRDGIYQSRITASKSNHQATKKQTRAWTGLKKERTREKKESTGGPGQIEIDDYLSAGFLGSHRKFFELQGYKEISMKQPKKPPEIPTVEPVEVPDPDPAEVPEPNPPVPEVVPEFPEEEPEITIPEEPTPEIPKEIPPTL